MQPIAQPVGGLGRPRSAIQRPSSSRSRACRKLRRRCNLRDVCCGSAPGVAGGDTALNLLLCRAYATGAYSCVRGGGIPPCLRHSRAPETAVAGPADRGVPGAATRGRRPPVRGHLPGARRWSPAPGWSRPCARRRPGWWAGCTATWSRSTTSGSRASSCSSSANTSRAPTWARCWPGPGCWRPGIAAFAALEVGEALTFVRAQEETATGVRTRLAGLSADVGDVRPRRQGEAAAHGLGPGGAVRGRRAGRARRRARCRWWRPRSWAPAAARRRGDVYAVGALLWQMLTGRPLAGGDAQAHLNELQTGRFRPRRAVVGGGRRRGPSPKRWTGWCWRRCRPRPADRPQSFPAFRSELAAVMRGAAGHRRARRAPAGGRDVQRRPGGPGDRAGPADRGRLPADGHRARSRRR